MNSKDITQLTVAIVNLFHLAAVMFHHWNERLAAKIREMLLTHVRGHTHLTHMDLLNDGFLLIIVELRPHKQALPLSCRPIQFLDQLQLLLTMQYSYSSSRPPGVPENIFARIFVLNCDSSDSCIFFRQLNFHNSAHSPDWLTKGLLFT
jgi:hypothetical protein